MSRLVLCGELYYYPVTVESREGPPKKPSFLELKTLVWYLLTFKKAKAT